MKLDEKALEAGARKEAEIDGRDFDALGRADKQRYLDRLSDAIRVYLETATPPDVARVATDEMVEVGHSSVGPFRSLYISKEEVRDILVAALAEPAGEAEPVADDGSMTAEEIRLENLKQMAKYDGPIVSFEVRAPYYLASCNNCGWVGSTERCGTDSWGDDSDVYCPRCHASGADCGKVAAKLTTPPDASAIREALKRSPAIEALTPTSEDWDRWCAVTQDTYDLMKRKIDAAFAALAGAKP